MSRGWPKLSLLLLALLVLWGCRGQARFSLACSLGGLASQASKGGGVAVESQALWALGWKWSRWSAAVEGSLLPNVRIAYEGNMSSHLQSKTLGLWLRYDFEESFKTKMYYRLGVQQEQLSLRQAIGTQRVQSDGQDYLLGWSLGWSRGSSENWETQVEVRQLFPALASPRQMDIRWLVVMGWAYHM